MSFHYFPACCSKDRPSGFFGKVGFPICTLIIIIIILKLSVIEARTLDFVLQSIVIHKIFLGRLLSKEGQKKVALYFYEAQVNNLKRC